MEKGYNLLESSNMNCKCDNNKIIGYIIITILVLAIMVIINSLVMYVNKKDIKKTYNDKSINDKTTSSVKDEDIEEIDKKEGILNICYKDTKKSDFDKFLFYFYFIHIIFVVFELVNNILHQFKIYELPEKAHSMVVFISIILSIIYLVYVFRFYVLKGKLI